MGLLVSDVIERAYEEIFEAGGVARPAWDVQSGSLDSSSLALVLEGRAQNTPPDGIVEWWDSTMEIADVYTTSGANVTLQTRGYLGTTAGSHSDGVKVVLDNPYPRYVLLNGLKSVISQLYGFGLYAKTNSAGSLSLSTSTPVSLPSGARDVAGNRIWVTDGSNYFPLIRGQHYEVIHAFTPPKIQFFPTVPWTGRAMYFDYKKDFTLPTALTDDLDTLGIPTSLQHHMALGLAGHVLAGRDVPMLENEHIRPDPQQPQQPGTKASIGRMLWGQFVSGPVQAERQKQLESNPTTIVERSY